MGDVEFNQAMFDAWEDVDYISFRDSIIDTINLPRVNIETVEQALKAIIKANEK